jgi:hypothetical protein
MVMGTARQVKRMLVTKAWKNLARGCIANDREAITAMMYPELVNSRATGVAWYMARNIIGGRDPLLFSYEWEGRT